MAAPVQTRPQYLELELDVDHTPWEQRGPIVRALLNVEASPRYTPGAKMTDKGVLVPSKGTTWCNVYLTDCIKAMGIEAPRHWMTTSGVPAVTGKGREMRANELAQWFLEHGPAYGWASADWKVASDAASRGHFVVVAQRNPKGPGHVAWLIGPDRISQAGGKNHFVCSVRMGFGVGVADSSLEWYVQMDRPGGHNG